jgi:acetyl-CoA C-acetyltransferase
MSANHGVAVVGLGIHPFGRHPGVSGLEMAAIAARAALADAGIGWQEVDFAAGGSDAAGNADTTVSVLGLTGVPFINVRNGCATGGSALTTAHAMLSAGSAEIALVVGFDKHPPGAFNPLPEDWGLGSWYGETGLMLTTQFFAMKIQRYMAEHGISESTLAKVASKAFDNGSRNPNAWRRRPLSEEEVLASKMVNHPLTQYMFCSPGEGAVALVLARGERAKSIARTPIHLRSVAFRTRRFGSFEVFSPSIPIESAPSPTAEAAAAAFEQAGIGPEDVDVAQLQDTESGAEIMHLAETGLCEHGAQESLIQSGATRLDGRLPVNTDGGCLANGEPIGASGLRQVHEVVLQLRGEAGERQVAGPHGVGFTQVYGAPGVSACTVLSR